MTSLLCFLHDLSLVLYPSDDDSPTLLMSEDTVQVQLRARFTFDSTDVTSPDTPAAAVLDPKFKQLKFLCEEEASVDEDPTCQDELGLYNSERPEISSPFTDGEKKANIS